jgi:ABC-type transport system involved in multi-copper enzyme maturation permease subunit
MSATTAPYRSDLPLGHDGFAQLLRAEWTKFRTVRGWVIGSVFAGSLIVLFAYLGTFRHQNYMNCSGPPGPSCVAHPHVPVGPDGEAVTDTYYFVHRTLTGNGSITVRLSSLRGRIQTGNPNFASVADMVGASGRVQPWAKVGLILTASTKPGSAYAAVMLTGAHGVRMQYDYIHDAAGPAVSARSPRWLRLTRSGATLTGYESADGTTWIKVGSAHLGRLPQVVQAGLFATSPMTEGTQQSFTGDQGQKATGVTATFDRLSARGGWSPSGWSAQHVGAHSLLPTLSSVGYHRTPTGFTVSGSGDIAPAVDLPAAHTDQLALTGVFIGLIVMIVLGAMFITTEFRRGLIDITFAASPRRGRVLAAKAIVIAAVAFTIGAAAAAVSIPLGNHILRTNGNYVYPTSTFTELRVVLGTGALVALTSVLALALGTTLRRSAGAITTAIVLIVLPYILAFASALPASASQWLMRLTPAAGFAAQQTLPQYHQVAYPYTPANGFYPFAPGVGLAVLGAYTLIALLIAHRLLRRRDA